MRRDHRRLRRRPPRSPARSVAPGPARSPRTRACRVVADHLRPAPDARWSVPGSHPPMLTTLPAPGRAGRGARASTPSASLPFTAEFSRLAAGRVRAPTCWSSGCTRPRSSSARTSASATRPPATSTLLRRWARPSGSPPRAIALDDDDVTLSSTYVRSCIDAGDVGQAAEALGRPHRIDGIVVRGDQRGRSSATRPPTCTPTGTSRSLPTASTPGWAGARAPQAAAGRDLRRHQPDVRGPASARVEAYILDFDEDLYGVELGVEFVARLRGMVRFDSVDDARRADGRATSSRTREMLR